MACNHDAFCVVRMPTPAPEQARSVSRAWRPKTAGLGSA